jgi:hypothetical protein
MGLMEQMVHMGLILEKLVEMLANPQKGSQVALLISGLIESLKNHSLLELQGKYKISLLIRYMIWDLMIFYTLMLRAVMADVGETEATDHQGQMVTKAKTLLNKPTGQMADPEVMEEMVEMLRVAKMEATVAL